MIIKSPLLAINSLMQDLFLIDLYNWLEIPHLDALVSFGTIFIELLKYEIYIFFLVI